MPRVTIKSLTRIAFVFGLAWLLAACQYHPSLSPAPGFKMQWGTRPAFFENYLRILFNWMDITPCRQTILGWADAHQMYYQTACGEFGGTAGTVVKYDVQTRVATVVSIAPSGLMSKKVPIYEVIENVRADGVRPVEYEYVTRRLYVESDGSASPDGRWTAFVAGWIYGPEDVLILYQD